MEKSEGGWGRATAPVLFMGSVKVIQGTYGFCSVIIDSQFCTWIEQHGFNDIQAYTGGQITQFGNELINELNAYHGNLKYTLLHNLTIREYDASSIIHILNIFGLDITYSEAFFRETITELFNTSTQSSYVRITPDDTDLLVSMSNDNADFWTSSGSAAPYGHLRDRTSYVNLRLVIPVFNDDMTSGYTVFFSMASDVGILTYHAYRENQTYFGKFSTWLNGIPEWKDNADPYTPGRTSEHGGGGRSFDGSSDPVDIPPVPVDPVLNSGFVSLYKMDTMKLMDLATFMWDADLFDVSAWQKVMANPFDAIISLKYVPANPNTLPNPAPIKIGNVQTNVSAPVVSQQYVQIQCGTLDVEEYSGSYLDYSPYTKVEIYLPFIGFRELNTDEVMDKTLTLTYNVDVLSGSCVANIKVGDTVLYQFAGECAMDIPITGRDSGKTLAGILGVIASAGSAVGGAIAGVLNPESAVKGVTAAAESVIGGKRNIQRSGNVTGSAGFMGGQTPYLIITRPRQALPEEQNLYMGYPSFITSMLGDLSGMTIVADCHLESIPCTDGELQEIERLLKEGVLL